MSKEVISVLIGEEELDRRIRELGKQISADFAGETVHVIGILKGGAPFACELSKRLTVPVIMDYLQVSSYGASTSTSGDVRFMKDLDIAIKGKNVLIAEDIIDTGMTLAAIRDSLAGRGAKQIKVCALLDKPERRILKKIEADYVGFSVPDKFVVGMGLDYDQKYRNLPYVGVLEFVDE